MGHEYWNVNHFSIQTLWKVWQQLGLLLSTTVSPFWNTLEHIWHSKQESVVGEGSASGEVAGVEGGMDAEVWLQPLVQLLRMHSAISSTSTSLLPNGMVVDVFVLSMVLLEDGGDSSPSLVSVSSCEVLVRFSVPLSSTAFPVYHFRAIKPEASSFPLLSSLSRIQYHWNVERVVRSMIARYVKSGWWDPLDPWFYLQTPALTKHFFQDIYISLLCFFLRFNLSCFRET